MSLLPPPGIYVPAVLFLDQNEDLDVTAIKAHVLRLAQGGITGILVHLQTLDENGFKHVIIIAGCGAPSSRESKRLCSDAKEAGAGYVLVLTPSVWPPQMTRDAILAFHRDVATHSPLPYLIFPTVTAGLDLDSDTILELYDHPTSSAQSSPGKLHRLTSAMPSSEFATLAGVSEVLLQGLVACGAAGCARAGWNGVGHWHGVNGDDMGMSTESSLCHKWGCGEWFRRVR